MNFEYKYQLSKSAVFDYRSVEKNLTKMAAKGWKLDHVGTFIWRFKPAEPAEKKFAVIFFNEKEFDPYQTEGRQMLQDFCQNDGWHKVGEWQNMHIFEAEPDAQELETDEAVRLQGIKKVMNSRVVKNNLMALCLMIFLMFNSWRRHSQGDSDPVEVLQQAWMMSFFAYAIVGIILQTLGYFGWVKKSEKNIDRGGTCARAGWYSILQDLFLLGIIPFTIGWMSAGSENLAPAAS